jgi:hypothetical protein
VVSRCFPMSEGEADSPAVAEEQEVLSTHLIAMLS